MRNQNKKAYRVSTNEHGMFYWCTKVSNSSHRATTPPPRFVAAANMVIDSKAAIRPYSIAVAPDWSFQNDLISLVIMNYHS